jgi:hypothetical protein
MLNVGRSIRYVVVATLAFVIGATSIALAVDEHGGLPALRLALMRERPVYLESGEATAGPFALGSDPNGPVKCTTADYTAPSPQRALVMTWFSLKADAPLTYTSVTATSTNGGATWTADGFGWQRATADAAGNWAPISYLAIVDLTAGSTYRFGVQVGRSFLDGGSGNALTHRCHLIVQITNRTNAPVDLE